jgi:hypothetical protein
MDHIQDISHTDFLEREQQKDQDFGNLWLRSYIHENTMLLRNYMQSEGNEQSQHFLFDRYGALKELVCFDRPAAYETKERTGGMRRQNAVHNGGSLSSLSRCAPGFSLRRTESFSRERNFYFDPPGKSFIGEL